MVPTAIWKKCQQVEETGRTNDVRPVAQTMIKTGRINDDRPVAQTMIRPVAQRIHVDTCMCIALQAIGHEI